MDEESVIGRIETPPRAFIYTGGSVFCENINDYERPKKGDFCIAADSGYKHALELSVKPDLLIGDFDSIENDTVLPNDTERITLPCEKDCTDTQAAFDAAVERGYDTIIIIGGLGTRLDHSLSSCAILEKMKKMRIHGYITNGRNRVRYLENDSLLIAKSDYKYFSLVALDRVCKGVSIDGGKYPLKNAKLFREEQFAVSNEIVGNVALISVKKGALLVIESRD